MCVIAVKPKGNDLPGLDLLENCWDGNSDGAGYMFRKDGQVIIRKGFMTWNLFLADYMSQELTKDDEVVYHFRIATQGGVNQECTHPFPISNNVKELKATRINYKWAMAHNGILDTPNSESLSDTMLYVKNLLWYMRKDLDNVQTRKMLEYTIHGSKIAILTDTSLHLMGNGWVHNKGIWYSNDSYEGWGKWYEKGDWRQDSICFAGEDDDDESYLNTYGMTKDALFQSVHDRDVAEYNNYCTCGGEAELMKSNYAVGFWICPDCFNTWDVLPH